jgi:hypothetical protein
LELREVLAVEEGEPQPVAGGYHQGIDKLSGVAPEDQTVRPSAAAAAAPRRDPLYRGHRFPAEGLGQAGWRSFRFAGSHRDGEDLLAERGVPVS